MDQTSPPAPSISSEIRTWCVLCHASALIGFFVPWAGHVLGPLIAWLAKRGDSAEIDAHGKESLNFQISMLIYNVIAVIYIIIASVLSVVLIGLLMVPLGVLIFVLLHILNVVLVIVASIQASEGKFYRYPFAIRLIK